MKKKYYYKGKVLVAGERLGHCFCLVKDIEKILCFTGKYYFAIGGVYEIDVNDKMIKTGDINYCEEDCKDRSLVESWQVESVMNETEDKRRRARKKLAKERANIEHMRLEEIKEKIKYDRAFKKLVYFYLLDGGFF